MRSRRALLGIFLVAAPLAARGSSPLAGRVGDPPLRVFLMTMGPGAQVYERFGHNAIWIRDLASGRDLIYNFGMFDFDAPNFTWNFVKGRPEYWLDAWDLDLTLRVYDHARRQVEVQELALTPARAAALAAALAENALPGNRTYRYDYFLDNCSTRVRDALDAALGGLLRRHTEGVPAEGSFRWHTQRLVSYNPWLYLGIQAGQGVRVDQPLDQWGEMFLPGKLQERLRELRVSDETGREVPLVTREATLLPHDTWTVPADRPDWTWPLLGVGALLAGAILTGLLAGPAGWLGRILTVGWSLLQLLGGALLLFLWFGTSHVMSQWNANVMLFTPFAVAIPLLMSWRSRPRWLDWLSVLYVVTAVIGAFDGFGLGQDNSELVALMLPPSLGALLVASVLNRRRAAAPPLPR